MDEISEDGMLSKRDQGLNVGGVTKRLKRQDQTCSGWKACTFLKGRER